jgi:hypothetical protein
MIIEDSVNVRHFMPEAAWAALQRFQNVAYVADQIVKLHSLTPREAQNAKKQARQLRYCLMQAREYYQASAAVSLATRPTLIYYSIMSLALAEILLKHTGDNSLDRAREKHRHHGLTFELAPRAINERATLVDAASQLIAKPLVIGGGRRSGTFELWHQTCRESPLVGKRQETGPHGHNLERVEVIAGAADVQLPPTPVSGLTLLDCLQNLPGMWDYLGIQGVPRRMLRARLAANVNPTSEQTYFSIVVHPSDLAPRFFDNILLHPSLHKNVNFKELTDGGAFEFRASFAENQELQSRENSFSIPPGVSWTGDETRFWSTKQPLNEFGYLYVALFMVGNYARYFPDRWLLDVENSTALALAVEELLRVADSRMAWLTLGELDRRIYVPIV